MLINDIFKYLHLENKVILAAGGQFQSFLLGEVKYESHSFSFFHTAAKFRQSAEIISPKPMFQTLITSEGFTRAQDL